MNKKLISAAVAAAIGSVPVMAQADGVTVYGIFQHELAYADNGTTSGWRLDDTGANSRVGLKADKDLGNGLKAVGVFEWITELCGSSGGSGGGDAGSNDNGCRQDFHTARQQFIGLQGAFGRLAFGRFNGTYKTYGATKYDALVATSMQARANGGMGQGPFMSNAFMDDVVEYQSPKLGPFKFQVQYGLDDPENPNGAANTKGDYNVGAAIGDKNWEVIAAFSHDDDGTDGTTCQRATEADPECNNWKIGGLLNFGPVRLTAQYEDVETGSNGDGKFYFGQLVYKIGKFDLIGTLGTFSDDDAANGTNDVDVWALGFKHHLAEKVFWYAGYRESKEDSTAARAGGKNKGGAIGMRFDF